MPDGIQSAASALRYWERKQEVLSNNLANATTDGFKAERVFARLLGTAFPTAEAATDFRVGTFKETGSPLDLAIEGDGFFLVQTANGLRFTRDGSFHRSQSGTLVTSSGEPVLSTANKPIPVPPGEVSVGADGVLSIAGGAVATVGVFTFPSGTQLTAEGVNRYSSPTGIPNALSNNAEVRQGSIEGANQDAIQGTLNLMMMQRQAEMMQKTLTIFHTEFNKFASEDLPRV